MNFLKIALKDISSIFKNRFIRVSVTAIIIVPLLYSLLYLAAFWDPYNRLSSLPVAIINLDKGAAQDGENKNYGKELEDKLRNNTRIGWKFVSYEEGMKGVEGKDYYAAFIIPENFSENVLSAKDGKPEKAEITYHANEKRNFLAAQINGKVLGELKAEITKGITQNYTEVVFDKLVEVKDGMKKAADGSKELADGIDKLNNKVPELKDGVGQLYDGSSKLADGIGQLNGKIPTLTSGVSQLYGGSTQLKDGIGQLNGNIPQLKDGVGKLYGASTQLSTGANLLNEKLDKGITYAIGEFSKGADKLSLGSQALSAGVPELNAGTQKLSDGAKQLDAGTKEFVSKSQQFTDGVNNYVNGVNTLISGSAESQKVLNQAVENNLKAYLKSNPSAMADKNMQAFLATLDGLNKQSQASAPSIATLQQGGNQLKAGVDSLKGGVTQFAKGVTDFSNGATGFASGATKFAAGATGYSAGANDFSKSATMLPNGLKEAVGGTKQLSQGLLQVKDGLAQLNDKVPALAQGGEKLLDGAVKLNDGLKQLNSNIPALAEGGNKLLDGSTKLNDGLKQLNDKLPELADGTKKLSDGSKEIHDKLLDGSNKLESNIKNDSKTMGEFVSEPLTINEKPINPVKDYGTGFAPYFLSLSLWIGALMMFFIITDKVDSDVQSGPISLVLGKFLSYGFIGTLQAILASVIVLVLGLKPANVPLYFLFNILLSFVFIAIMQSLIFLLGQVGRLLSIILLILQLTACAGTFPLELVPKFFKVLNPIMPFTYSVSGLREIISGVDYSVLAKDSMILVAVMVVFLVISIIMKERADKFQEKISQKKEESMTVLD